MPNKYEREIEEILRNLERTEPKARFGQRVGERMRRKPGPRGGISLPHLNFPEWCLVIALAAALFAGGWAYANYADVMTGSIALVGAVCILLVALSNFINRPRYQASSTRYNNVTRLRTGNPLRRMATSWHLLMLKLRYRRRNDRER
jgi:hypothetical protein